MQERLKCSNRRLVQQGRPHRWEQQRPKIQASPSQCREDTFTADAADTNPDESSPAFSKSRVELISCLPEPTLSSPLSLPPPPLLPHTHTIPVTPPRPPTPVHKHRTGTRCTPTLHPVRAYYQPTSRRDPHPIPLSPSVPQGINSFLVYDLVTAVRYACDDRWRVWRCYLNFYKMCVRLSSPCSEFVFFLFSLSQVFLCRFLFAVCLVFIIEPISNVCLYLTDRKFRIKSPSSTFHIPFRSIEGSCLLFLPYLRANHFCEYSLCPCL